MTETYAVKRGTRWVAVHFDPIKGQCRAANSDGRGGYRTVTGNGSRQVSALVRDCAATRPTLRSLRLDYPDAVRRADSDV